MRKTAYNRLKKVLLSGDQTWINRNGDSILLTEGHIVASIPYSDYETYFVGDVFPAVPLYGGFVRTHSLRNGDFVEAETGNIRSRIDDSIYELTHSHDDISASVVGEYNYIGKHVNRPQRIVYIDTKHDGVLINAKFYNAVLPFMGKDTTVYGYNRRNPIYIDGGDRYALIFGIQYYDIESTIDIENAAA